MILLASPFTSDGSVLASNNLRAGSKARWRAYVKVFSSAVIILLCCLVITGQQLRPAPIIATPRQFTIADLLKLRRVADPQISPDSQWVAYTIADTDKSANKRVSQIYVVPISGGEPRAVTSDPVSSTSPRWSPDGKRLAFVSAREAGPQIWTIEIEGGQLKKLSNVATGVSGPVWSPDGKWIAFTSDVNPQCANDDCNRRLDEEKAKSKVQAKIADRLLYRHWNSWKEGKRTHILVVPGDGGEARDLTPGDFDAPPFNLGGPDDYAFSPDSKELAFVRNTDRVEALSTNGDIFVVPVAEAGDARRLTGDNPANDLSPQYSPDGRFIAYRAQSIPGFEADRWRLNLYDRKNGSIRSLTEQMDSSVGTFTFSNDGQKIYFVAEERARQPVYQVPVSGGAPRRLISEGFNDDVKIAPDGKSMIFTRQSIRQPIELFRAALDGGELTPLTRTNDAALAEFGLKPADEATWEGAAGSRVHGLIVKPANFAPGKKWPMIALIHGGPQSAWTDSWSYRWNAQVFASAGYVVLLPNPRGSTGYGQKFCDDISGDWGGRPFTDILNGVAYLCSLGYIDKERLGAAGGSYGGYMVDWIEGHNDDPRFQFKALVSHAGVYNLTSMYGATEELWFPEWDFKGTPWTNPEMYAKWSPHLFAKNFKTPMLVINGELDYRVPVTEGLQLFTALQRQGVESKLLYFPDEGHWVLKPLNSELWYNTVLDWFDPHLKPRKE
jgi:dipeptidyl aminopeptidase/acylaminoacyl peptidase